MANSKLLVLLLVFFCVSSVLALSTKYIRKSDRNGKAAALLNKSEASRETNNVFSATSDLNKIQKLSGKIPFTLPRRKGAGGNKGGDDFDGDDGGDDFDPGDNEFGLEFGDDSFGDDGFGDDGFDQEGFEESGKDGKQNKGRNQKDTSVKAKGGRKTDDEETEGQDNGDEEDPFAEDLSELDEFGLLEGDESGDADEEKESKPKGGRSKQSGRTRNNEEDEDVEKSSSDEDNESSSGKGGRFKIKLTPKLAELRKKAQDKPAEKEDNQQNEKLHWFQASNTYALKCKFPTANLREVRKIQDELSCGQLCDSTPKCTHFTYLDKVCRLHAGPIEMSSVLDDPKSSCGFASIKDENWKPLGDKSVSLAAKACDFLDKDGKTEDVKTDKECAEACAKAWPECTHFTFVKNVCQLKKANLVVKISAFASYDDTATCGILTRMLPREKKP